MYFLQNADEEEEVWSSVSESECEEVNEEEPQFQPLEDTSQATKERALGTWMTILILYLHVKYHLTGKFTTTLFSLLKVFVTVIGRFSSFCALSLPGNLNQAYKCHDIGKERFKRYVVCRKCHQVYHLRECIEQTGTNRKSKLCSYKGLEKHTCCTVLLKTVEVINRKHSLHSTSFILLQTSLQFLLTSSSFVENCEYWRKRTTVDVC